MSQIWVTNLDKLYHLQNLKSTGLNLQNNYKEAHPTLQLSNFYNQSLTSIDLAGRSAAIASRELPCKSTGGMVYSRRRAWYTWACNKHTHSPQG